jgi:hypothetical protein
VLRPCYQPRLLNQVFVRAKSHVFHTIIVYTIIVRIADESRPS